MRRGLRVALWAALALVLLVAAAIGALVWRASSAPLSVAFLIPRLEAAVNTGGSAPVVRIGSLFVVWSAHEDQLELRAGDISVAEAGGVHTVSVAQANVELDPWALLRGRIVLSSVDVDGASVHVARRRDGSFGLNLEPSVPAPGEPAAGPRLTALEDGAGPFAQLREIGLRDGAILLVDEASGRSWRAAGVDVNVTREPSEISLRGRFSLVLGAAVIPCEAHASFDPSSDTGVANLSFRGLVPSAVADSLRGATDVVDDASLAPTLASLTMPVAGSVDVALGHRLAIDVVHLSIAGGSAQLALPGAHHFSLPVNSFSLATTLDLVHDRFNLDDASLDVGDAVLTATAALVPLRGPSTVEATAKIATLKADALRRLWPPDLAASARSWVTANISDGSVKGLEVRVRGKEGATPTTPAAIDSVEGRLGFDGLRVRYVDTMPPVKDVKGRAAFSLKGFHFDVSGGRVDQLDVTKGKVQIHFPQKGGPTIAIEATVRGQLSSALAVADAEPLRVAAAIGVVPSAVGGTTDATAHFAFPLGGTFRSDRLRWGVAAKLRDAAVPRLIGAWSISDGALAVDANPSNVTVAGSVKLEGAPLEGSFRKELRGSRAQTADVHGRIDRAQRAALGLDPGAWLDGPVEVKAQLTQTGADALSVALDADLAPATLALAALPFEKPAGQPGRARARVTLVKQKVTAVDGIDVAVAGATLQGSVARARDGVHWSRMTADLTLPVAGDSSRPARVHAQLQQAKAGYSVALNSPDAGAILAAYGRQTVRGGAATFSGTIAGPDLSGSLDGRFELKTFTVSGMPWLVRLATLASIDGLSTALSGSGVNLTDATADLSLRGSALKVSSGVAQGPTMTVALDGTIHLDQATIEAEGSLLPVAFDRITDKIPLLGRLVGAAARSVFDGVDFSVSGPLSDPKVSVYPLSTLTPGALKSIYRAIRK